MILEARDQGVRCGQLRGHRWQVQHTIWLMRYLLPDSLEERGVQVRLLQENLEDRGYVEIEQVNVAFHAGLN